MGLPLPAILILSIIALCISTPMTTRYENDYNAPMLTEEETREYHKQLRTMQMEAMQQNMPNQYQPMHQQQSLASMILPPHLESPAVTGRDVVLAEDPMASVSKSAYEAYLLQRGKCQTISTWCCGKKTYILCTCGGTDKCYMTFKNIGTYNYTVQNANFTDVSGRYWLTPVTLCNTGKRGVIFVSSY